MLWLVIVISAYFLLAIVYLVDKYLLKKGIPNPKVFAFYVGFLWILALLLIPFVGFYVPGIKQIILSLLAGAFLIYALFWFYKTLRLFEASRVVPAIGGMTPIFTFGLVYFFSFGKNTLSFSGSISFLLLVCGSVLITLPSHIFNLNSLKKTRNVKFADLRDFFQRHLLGKGSFDFRFSAITAFFFSLSFVLTKYVYLGQTFWNGFIWRSIGGFLMAIIFFLLFPEIKKEIFKKKASFDKKTFMIFLSGQSTSAFAGILQNWAIALASLSYVSVINALQGVQYVFLFIFTIILSLKFPKILKEEVSKGIIFQKTVAIALIVVGVVILVF